MNPIEIKKILEDNAYIRVSGTPEELRCAEYIRDYVTSFGCQAEMQPFPVDMANITDAQLTADGVSIPCKGYFCAGSWEVEAPFYYLRSKDPVGLGQCRGKIVLVDGYVGYWVYQDLLKAGAVGFISYNGTVQFPDNDIDQRELRSYVHNGNRMPGVNINVRDAIELVKQNPESVKIVLSQEEWEGESHNVVLDLPGEVPEYIAFTAHFDSTSLSQGVYDNMSGSVCLLALAEHFAKHPHRNGLRFIWCGSEERGLLGSKFYCSSQERLENCVLNINVDLFGCIMGKFLAVVTGEQGLCQYISYFGAEHGWSLEVKQDIFSSDSTPFADKGVPAVSFARIAPKEAASYHNRYDTLEVMSEYQMAEDIAFVQKFADRMANCAVFPVKREIPDNVREKLDVYLGRKRKD